MKSRRPPLPNALALLAATLAFPLAAAAGPAARTIASDICSYASDLPGGLQDEIEDTLVDAGFLGLPADQCDKFVKSLVKSCQAMVKASTACTVDVNATAGLNAGKMSELGCATQPDKDSQKSCKSTVKSNTKSNHATASQTVQILGSNACNRNFAAAMNDLCLDGVIAP